MKVPRGFFFFSPKREAAQMLPSTTKTHHGNAALIPASPELLVGLLEGEGGLGSEQPPKRVPAPGALLFPTHLISSAL